MTGKELRKNRGIISTQYFGLDEGECYLPYSREYSMVQTELDYDTNEVVVVMISRWNSSYNREIRIKL